ncbi:hypothetical protein [Bdellovibrio sp. NC01]|uniref:hypothetical protein n=1 Tax=Bdellovibrio sp. NC01 TaxID=2220073 RepID=UPI0011586499|nr:hypothetical protein [Bdellovibrio sp. NC01]QDK37552.1 hypothetical protein DOE51_08125 [Bdellovibrio sp. NC01]
MRSSLLSMITILFFANAAQANSGIVSRSQTHGAGVLNGASLSIAVDAVTADYNSTFGDTVICTYQTQVAINGVATALSIYPAHVDTSYSPCDKEMGKANVAQWKKSLTKEDLPYTFEQSTLVTYGNSGTWEEMQHCYQQTEVETTVMLEDGTVLHGTHYLPRIEVPMNICEK